MSMFETEKKPDRAIIIAVSQKGKNRELVEDSLKELKALCETAGAEVVMKMTQELPKINTATCIGSGKIEEIKEIIEEKEIQLIVFDDELSPMQNRNLMQELNIMVTDRSGIILEIFVKHAKTQEAKTQVELAQVQYMLPRLTRLWTHLSKQYGGVGTNAKGPGETQIETDRRLLKERVQFLKGKLVDIDKQKLTQRKGRKELLRFALVGYTNAGKSTLMNKITDANVYIEDKLFATLDTTVRKFTLPNGVNALLSDTVGFIHKLPHHLVASFRSTLSEALEADFIVHCIDLSHPNYELHIQVVNETLESLGITGIPIIHLFNKIDKLDNDDKRIIPYLEERYPNFVAISAKQGNGIEALMDMFVELNEYNSKTINLFVPYTKMGKINSIYDNAEVLERHETDEGIALKLKVKKTYSALFHNLYKEFLR